MSDPSALFRPIHVSALALSRRIVMAPMTRNADGRGDVDDPALAELDHVPLEPARALDV